MITGNLSMGEGAVVLGHIKVHGEAALARGACVKGALFALDGPKGNRFLLRILRPGDLFGESFALDGEPAGVLVEARNELRVDLIPAHRIAALEKAHPEIEQALAGLASQPRGLPPPSQLLSGQ